LLKQAVTNLDDFRITIHQLGESFWALWPLFLAILEVRLLFTRKPLSIFCLLSGNFDRSAPTLGQIDSLQHYVGHAQSRRTGHLDRSEPADRITWIVFLKDTIVKFVRKDDAMRLGLRMAVVAWLLAAVYYFYQYLLRSAPAVMMPELSEAFGLSAMQVAAIAGIFYYGYSPFSLVAGTALDRYGPRKILPIGAATVGVGALLFSTGNETAASVGRFLQGAGGVFALVGAVTIATRSFSPSKAATLIGATQMFGMAGGSAGQSVVGPLISGGLPWNYFWLGMGVIGLLMSGLLFVFLPRQETQSQSGSWANAIAALAVVFKNPQSILCGVISGLLFLPTTIFDMIWGVRFLQEAHGFDYASAVLRSSMVPLGWIIGCPLLGMLSDRIGRRKPVILGGAAILLVCLCWILYGRPDVFPPYIIGLLAGMASGAAMLPYTVIKEANRPEHAGTATGVVNFLNFTASALLGPVFGWILQKVSGGASQITLEHFQTGFQPLLYGVAIAIILTLFLRETGSAVLQSRKVA
jgi:MFS family permease